MNVKVFGQKYCDIWFCLPRPSIYEALLRQSQIINMHIVYQYIAYIYHNIILRLHYPVLIRCQLNLSLNKQLTLRETAQIAWCGLPLGWHWSVLSVHLSVFAHSLLHFVVLDSFIVEKNGLFLFSFIFKMWLEHFKKMLRCFCHTEHTSSGGIMSTGTYKSLYLLVTGKQLDGIWYESFFFFLLLFWQMYCLWPP